MQASLMTEQPKLAISDFTPLIEHCAAGVVVEAFEVEVLVVLEVFVVLEVLVELGVLVELVPFLVVVEVLVKLVLFLVELRGVVVAAIGFLFFFKLSHGAVTVTCATPVGPDIVTVEVTSLIGTKELQKADALRATSTALHAATLSRASTSERPMLAAEMYVASNAKVAMMGAGGMNMVDGCGSA
jgi:hypothetical protein